MVERWDSARDGDFSEEKLRARLEARGYSIDRWVYPAGTVFDWHDHDVDKIDAVVTGRLRIRTRDSEVVLAPGDAIAVPAGTEHTAEVVGPEPVTSLDAIRFLLST